MAMNTITCPACGVEEAVRDGAPALLHLVGLFRCEGCAGRFVFGKAIPRIAVEPYEENGVRFVRLRFQDPATKQDVYTADVDQNLAVVLAKNILSISVP